MTGERGALLVAHQAFADIVATVKGEKRVEVEMGSGWDFVLSHLASLRP